jgi:hypothetical protein
LQPVHSEPCRVPAMSDDLALLPDEVRLAAHVLANGEVEWPVSGAREPICALGDRGFLLLGLDYRDYDADYVRSTAWSSQTAGRFW